MCSLTGFWQSVGCAAKNDSAAWQAGFSVEVTDLRRWEQLPIKRRQLADEFLDIPQDTLCVCGFDVLLRKAASSMENIF
jgi:hypothetical protein